VLLALVPALSLLTVVSVACPCYRPSGCAPSLPTQNTLDIARLNRSIAAFAVAADALWQEAASVAAEYSDARSGSVAALEPLVLRVRSVNDRLMGIDRALLLDEGLPGRSWYKHSVSSPSLVDAYSATAFPGVSDAVASGQWRLAQRQLDAVCHLIDRAALFMQTTKTGDNS
jgi:N-acetylated-alpha-linked acidic dipeptidase